MMSFTPRKFSARPVLLVISLLVLCLMMTNCAYYPQFNDVPLLSKEGEMRLDGGVCTAIAAQASLSYALPRGVALQAYGNGSEDVLYGEGSLGVYRLLNAKSVMEVYAGIGQGFAGHSKMGSGARECSGYQQYFLRFNIGEKDAGRKGHIDYGASLKTGILHAQTSSIEQLYWMNGDNYVLSSSEQFVLLEPQIFIRGGGDHVRIGLRAGACSLIKCSGGMDLFDFARINIGVSLNYRLHLY